MAGQTLSDVVQFLRRLVRPTGSGGTDRELLDQFVATRDERAFETLVQRYGPMVLAVCRQMLFEPADAEDAFQATFLVLVRRAASIRRGELLGNWLYGVAYRVAVRLRATTARRHFHERQGVEMSALDSAEDPQTSGLHPVLHEELNRLPDQYRVPIVLCYLQGKTHEEAARELCWPLGTVKTRLSRGRERLRARLTSRGVTLSAAALTVLLVPQAASASVPAALVDSTVKAGLLVAAGQGAAGAVSAQVLALTEGVIRTMFLTKIKFAAAIVLAACVIGVGIASYPYSIAIGGVPAAAAQAKPRPAAEPAKPPADDRERLLGTWKFISLLVDGEEPPEATQIKTDGRFMVTKEAIYFKEGETSKGRMTYALDATRKPKVIDLKHEEIGENETIPGIYAVDGDDLKICFAAKPGVERPKGFTSTPASGHAFFVLKRDKDAKPLDEKKEKAAGNEAARKALSANNLKQLALAMHIYYDQNKHLPPAAICDKNGKPLLSWRVALLPFIEQDALYQQFKLDEPWDSKHNKKLLAQMPKLFAPVGVQPKEKNVTFYQVFTGKGTLFDGNDGITFPDVTDGTSNTVMIVEAAEAVPWTKPEDLSFDLDKALPKLGGLFGGDFHFTLADGSVHFAKKAFNEDTLRKIVTRNGGEIVDLRDLNP